MPTLVKSERGDRRRGMGNGVFIAVFVVVIAAVLFIFNLLSGGSFLEWTNLKGILARSVYPSFIAWGLVSAS